MDKKSFKAFTLAEVLITLTIIGVIAALTIPNLVKKYEQQQTLAAFKKNYSLLNTALQSAIYDYGEPSTWQYVNANYWNKNVGMAVADKFKPYLKIKKTCENNNDTKKCWDYDVYEHKQTGSTKFTCMFGWNCSGWSVAYTLEDGTNLLFNTIGNGSGPIILVDLNGAKGPNRLGRDVFQFCIHTKDQYKQYPYYNKLYGPNYYHLTNVKQMINYYSGCGRLTGIGCSTVILKDNFQIKDYYPW